MHSNKCTKGVNDIFTTHPHLKNEWDFKHNASEGIFPENITATYKKKVWWLTPNGISYQQDPHHKIRVINKDNRFVTKVLVKGYNDFGTVYPEQAKEWDYKGNAPLKPCDVLYGSGKRVSWICPNGHKYTNTPHERGERETGCPICSARRQTSFPEQAIYYYFKKIYPDTLNRYKKIFDNGMELDIYIPSINIGIEYDGGFWHDSNESLKRENVKFEICRKHGIKLIRIKQVKNELLDEDKFFSYDKFPPADDTYFLKQKYKTYELEFLIQNLLNKYDFKNQTFSPQLGFHSKIRVNLARDKNEIKEYLTSIKDSLESKRPDIAAEWHPTKNGSLKPSMFSVSSNEIVWWKCKACGNDYKMSINGRTRPRGSGCGICALKKRGRSFTKGVVARVGSLAQTHPQLAKEWHPTKNGNLTPNDVTAGRFKAAWWLCPKCGYEWLASPNLRKRGIGCPHCSGRVAMPGVDDLATTHPQLLMDWDYSKNKVDPKTIKAGSGYKAHWRCHVCGYEWVAIVNSRKKGHGCRKCSNHKRWYGTRL